MAKTDKLQLNKPTIGASIDSWGTELNQNMDLIDQNCYHSLNPVPSSAINVSSDLTINNFNIQGIKGLRLNAQPTTANSSADVLTLYSYNNELYWNTVAGSPVKLTSGTGINSSGVTNNVYVVQAVSGTLTISASDQFELLLVNTTAARTINLPAANAVGAGRRYKIKDISGLAQTNNITLVRSGTNTIEGVGANRALSTNWGSWEIVSDGTSAWYLLG